MPTPKPRIHLICSLCKRRERATGGLCAPCNAYYEAMCETKDIVFLRDQIKNDKVRQNTSLEAQNTSLKAQNTSLKAQKQALEAQDI